SSLARLNRKTWYSALFAKISNDDDEPAERHEGRSGGKPSQCDCRQADQDPDSPFGQKLRTYGPPRHVEDCSDQDHQGDRTADRQDCRANKAALMRVELHWMSTLFGKDKRRWGK